MRLFLLPAAIIAIALDSGVAAGQFKPAKPVNPDKPYATGAQSAKDDKAHAKNRANHWNAAAATKEMLIKHGYKVVGVETLQDGHVLYFRRGDVVLVRDIGQVGKVTVRPEGDAVAIEGAPAAVLADVKLKLGL